MATTTRTRKMSGGTSTSNKRTRTPLSRRVAAMYGSLCSSLPEIAGTPRFRRELLGVVLILMALLSAYVIGRGGDGLGRLVAWWGSSLDRSLGRAAFLVPVLIALAALRAFGGQPGRVLEGRHYLGGFAFTVAVVGLLHLGVRSDAEPAGGALGGAGRDACLSHFGTVRRWTRSLCRRKFWRSFCWPAATFRLSAMTRALCSMRPGARLRSLSQH